MMISVVVPVYNSCRSLSELYSRLVPVLNELADTWEIIMVDDASHDDSYRVMKTIRQADRRVKLISLEENAGQHHATLCGLRYSFGQYVVTIDDDLQTPPEEIPLLMAEIQKDHDVVFGIPREKQHQVYRNWGSRGIDRIINTIFPHAAGIRRSSFRIMTRELVDRMLQQVRTPVYMAALILTHSQQPGQVEVEHHQRKYGHSNYTVVKTLVMTRNLLINYSWLPLKSAAGLWGLWSLAAISWLPANRLDSWAAAGIVSIIILVIGILLALITLWLGWEYWLRWERGKRYIPPYVIRSIEM